MPGVSGFDVDHVHRHDSPRRIAGGNGVLASAVDTGLRPRRFEIDEPPTDQIEQGECP